MSTSTVYDVKTTIDEIGTIPSQSRVGIEAQDGEERENRAGSGDEEGNEHNKETASPGEPTLQQPNHLHGIRLVFVFVGMVLAVFLVALDQTLLSVAQTAIATDLKALTDISWVITSFFCTQAAFMLVYGQLLTLWPSKWCVGVL